MVEEDNLPFGFRFRELSIEPTELIVIQIHGVEREELYAIADERGQQAGFPLKRVVPLSAHVEERIHPLRAGVVVAARRVEPDACVKKRLVRLLESLSIRLRRAVPVIVVAKHEDQIEGNVRALRRKLRGRFALLSTPLAGVADDGELQRGTAAMRAAARGRR